MYLFVVNERAVIVQVGIRACELHDRNKSTTMKNDRCTRMVNATWCVVPKGWGWGLNIHQCGKIM